MALRKRRGGINGPVGSQVLEIDAVEPDGARVAGLLGDGDGGSFSRRESVQALGPVLALTLLEQVSRNAPAASRSLRVRS